MPSQPAGRGRWLTLSRRLWGAGLVLWVAIVYVGTHGGTLGFGESAVGFVLLGLVSVARNADPSRGWPRGVALVASVGFIALCGMLIHQRWGRSDWAYVGMLVAIAGLYLALVATALALERSRAPRG